MNLYRRMRIRILSKLCKDRYDARLKAEKPKEENSEKSEVKEK